MRRIVSTELDGRCLAAAALVDDATAERRASGIGRQLLHVPFERGPGGGRNRLLRRFLAAALLLAAPIVAQTRGYVPRACGFDMDDDGIVGEPEDCCVCDGTTADPDGDGTDEDLIYVSSSTGVDSPGCGAPASPCATITYAIETATASDGPRDHAEEIYCLAGTFTEGGIDPLFDGGGVAGTTSIAATGSQERDWEHSNDPVMIVGWDADGDGSYPPFDTDDTCVVDGSGTSITHAITLDGGGGGSHVEIAHCTFRDFGADYPAMDDTTTGFLNGEHPGDYSHVWLHDLSLLGINEGRGAWSGVITWNQFGGRWSWIQWNDFEALDWSGFWTRGAAESGAGARAEGPWRIQNMTGRTRGCGNETCDSSRSGASIVKTWGFYTGIEVLDSAFDGNPDGWIGDFAEGHTGLVFEACNRDFVARNNSFADIYLPLQVAPHQRDAFCGGAKARTASGLVFDRNLITNDRAFDDVLGEGVMQVLPGGETAGEQLEDLTVTNNVVICTQPLDYFTFDRGGHGIGTGGTTPVIVYDHNTWNCDVQRDRLALFEIDDSANTTEASRTISNNLVQGLEVTDDVGDANGGTPTWRANRYDRGHIVPASGWTQCTASFEADGLHLDSSDTCAIDYASGSTVTVDYDGVPRTDRFDVGADEEGGVEGGGAEEEAKSGRHRE